MHLQNRYPNTDPIMATTIFGHHEHQSDAKARPLFKFLNERFLQFGVWAEHLSIDETKVQYFGRHSTKMFICGKPVRFGYIRIDVN